MLRFNRILTIINIGGSFLSLPLYIYCLYSHNFQLKLIVQYTYIGI